MEEWKQLEEHYEISNFGRVRNNQTGKVLKTLKCNGYKSKVTLTLENNSRKKDIFLVSTFK